MSALKADYMPFYLEGREEKTIKNDIDVDKLAERCLAGENPRTVVVAAVSGLRTQLEHDKRKKVWLETFTSEIAEAGGDGNEAWRHYCTGRVDELEHALEADVIEAMADELDDGEDDDEDDEDGDED